MGEYRWIENALYGMLGAWVTDMPVPAVQVHLDGQSLRHAWHADLWADRLPVQAGADPTGLTVPSATSAALFAVLDGHAPATAPPARPGPRPRRSPAAVREPCPGWPASTGCCFHAW